MTKICSFRTLFCQVCSDNKLQFPSDGRGGGRGVKASDGGAVVLVPPLITPFKYKTRVYFQIWDMHCKTFQKADTSN